MLKDIKLIATDMDGTFVPPGVFELPREDYELIRRLQEKGIVFAVASGRPYCSMRRMFAPVADKMMFICDNGCSIVWQDRCIYSCPMDQKTSFELADYIETLPKEYESIMVTTENYVMMPKRDEDVIRVLRDWNMSVRIVKRKEDVVDPIIKQTIFKADGHSWKFIDEMKDKWQGRVKHVTESCIEWLDFHDGDKGTSLKKAAELLNISLENTAAFGDGGNDVEMLDIAGYSYAMADAPDYVKAHAKYQCADVRDVLRDI